jgi:hypothetical protein
MFQVGQALPLASLRVPWAEEVKEQLGVPIDAQMCMLKCF